ncbi:Imm10 family immunity protein [Streptomyces sp. NPDC002701]|uniref:Imm10 family immunity protein n=1 Tax=Streptomyces sp. NPDC002701 TaxID=3364661 RepID=UPI0036851060
MSRLDWPIRVVTADENLSDSCFVLGVASDEYGEGGNFIFQCGLSAPDEQARRLELDSYCVLSQEGGVQYGGVESISLSAGVLSFRFSVEAVAELDIPTQNIEIEIAQGVDIEVLRNGLRRVFTYGNPEKIPQMTNI